MNEKSDPELGISPQVSYPGFFISIEGGDWTGKSTQCRLLEETLNQLSGNDLVRHTFEPGSTRLGQVLRDAVMHGENLDPFTEALIYAADRGHHLHSRIKPWLESGRVVVCDRYLDSSIAYQGYGRGLGEERIRELSLWATEGYLPDLTIVLDGDPEQLLTSRSRGELDRIEQSGLPFHQRVRESFRALVSADHAATCPNQTDSLLISSGLTQPPRMYLVDAQAPITEVHRQILKILSDQAQYLLRIDRARVEDGLPSRSGATGEILELLTTCTTGVEQS